jgi:hypothetical protein
LTWVVVAAARSASAQTPDGGPDPAQVRLRIGPLMMNPTISLTNLGVDQNVFNEPDEQAPEKDFTFTITPAANIWMRMGRSWLTAVVREDIVWYQEFSSERSAGNTYTVGWNAPLNRLLLKAGAMYVTAGDRPGFEIDARAHRRQISYNGAAEIRAVSKTLLGVHIEQQHLDFDEGASFDGINLHDELSFQSTVAGVSIRHELTPLTSVSVAASRGQDRFRYTPLRDSDSDLIAGTITFNSFAVIKGSATIGYRQFKPLSSAVPGFEGTTALASLSYTFMGATRFGFTAKRDLQYSYDAEQPYYLESGYDLTIAQQIFGPFDVVIRGGAHDLAYRSRTDVAIPSPERTDRVLSYGAGLGYHMGKELRLGFNVDNIGRQSDRADRRYDNLRVGTAITYGF